MSMVDARWVLRLLGGEGNVRKQKTRLDPRLGQWSVAERLRATDDNKRDPSCTHIARAKQINASGLSRIEVDPLNGFTGSYDACNRCAPCSGSI